jgi:hypothetical protein
MKFAGMIKGLAVCLAVLGFCLPQPLWAAVSTGQSPAVLDVKLHASPNGNLLFGQVQDPQGAAKANVPVDLYQGGQKLAETRTDQNGYFRFTNLRGGVYQVATAGGAAAYRVWTAQTAPPSAQPGALIIADEDLVRGQSCFGRLKFWLSHPLVIAGVVATAVAVPVALACEKEEEAPPATP